MLLKLNGCQVYIKSTFAEAGAVHHHSQRPIELIFALKYKVSIAISASQLIGFQVA